MVMATVVTLLEGELNPVIANCYWQLLTAPVHNHRMENHRDKKRVIYLALHGARLPGHLATLASRPL